MFNALSSMHFGTIKLQHQKSENEADVNTPGENSGTWGFDAETSGKQKDTDKHQGIKC